MTRKRFPASSIGAPSRRWSRTAAWSDASRSPTIRRRRRCSMPFRRWCIRRCGLRGRRSAKAGARGVRAPAMTASVKSPGTKRSRSVAEELQRVRHTPRRRFDLRRFLRLVVCRPRASRPHAGTPVSVPGRRLRRPAWQLQLRRRAILSAACDRHVRAGDRPGHRLAVRSSSTRACSWPSAAWR